MTYAIDKIQSCEEAFQKFTTRRKTKIGFSIRCKKGLWGVKAGTKEDALREARHYFVQYFMDGEYK